MRTLDVVNEMLGTMGEAPISSLEDPHTFRGACLSTLNNQNARIQSRGWWFNSEAITLSPSALDSSIYLPGDTINVRVPRASAEDTSPYVQRGRRLYNTNGGTFVFTTAQDVTIIRQVPFEELPELAAQHIAASAVVQFQSKYDSDSIKTRELRDRVEHPTTGTLFYLVAEDMRNRRVNLIDSNSRLQRLKSLTNGARRFIR